MKNREILPINESNAMAEAQLFQKSDNKKSCGVMSEGGQLKRHNNRNTVG